MIELTAIAVCVAAAIIWIWCDLKKPDAPHEDDEYSGRTRRDIEDEYRKAQD